MRDGVKSLDPQPLQIHPSVKYIPGFDTYKALAEEELQNKVRLLPYACGVIKEQEYWRPVYIIEEDHDGKYVVFLPDIPDQVRFRKQSTGCNSEVACVPILIRKGGH